MRKTGLYGKGTKENVMWPTESDLLKMITNIPTKIIDLNHQKSTTDSGLFGAFQVILSNGISSPVFNAASTKVQDMQSFLVSDYSLVKRVNGTKLGVAFLGCLILSKKDGT
jgi:hypothetical protein